MIESSEKDGVAILVLAHGKANAMDLELCQAVRECFEQLKSAPARAVVLTGRDNIFSAGVDLVRASSGPEYLRKFLPALNAMFEAVFYFPKPVVAALNGHAIAGGCILACCADRRLMARAAGRIGVSELRVGVPFPALAFEVMRFVTTPTLFPQAIYGGETYSPEEGAARGWVEVVEPTQLMARSLAEAQALAALPAAVFAVTKRQMRLSVNARLARAGRALDAAVAALWTAPETRERICDYVARTFKKR